MEAEKILNRYRLLIALCVLYCSFACVFAGDCNCLSELSTTVGTPGSKFGLLQNDEGAFDGYTLLAPTTSKTTYLIDNDGRVVHTWQSERWPAHVAYLLENGHLLQLAGSTFCAGVSGGHVLEYAWDGTLIWDYQYSTDDFLLHHDIELLPNGNVLMTAWERKTAEQAIDAGRDPQLLEDNVLWTDFVIEVKPTGPKSGEIVWQWHIWDHLIQDSDRSKQNYGIVQNHPELININPANWLVRLSPEERKKLESLGYIGQSTTNNKNHSNPDWTHTNSIAYNAELDQIVLSVLGFNEIWIIDHSTTTKQAAGHTGGKSGKGGDLLYRWGNPETYRAGSQQDQMLFAQHDASWIPPGQMGEGNLLVFNNGRGRPDGSYSSVDELVPPVDKKGRYARKKGDAFGPTKTLWTYTAKDKTRFYSSYISGANRLANGNTLICSGADGEIFEVTPEKKVVWRYVFPIASWLRRASQTTDRNTPQRRWRKKGTPGPQNDIFKAYRYPPDYPAFQGKSLTPGKTVEELLSEKP